MRQAKSLSFLNHPVRSTGMALASLAVAAQAALVALPLAVAFPGTAQAQDMRIAAVVNDDIISVSDLDARIRLTLASSGIPDTPENRQRMMPQIMRQLIDEKLEMQAAKKESVQVDDDDVKTAITNLEKDNHMPPGGIDTFLKERGIPRETLVQQISATIAWARTLRRRFMPDITIGDDEVNDAIRVIEQNRDKPQSRVAEIFLSVDKPAQDSEVRASAEKLMDAMRQGARFALVARQFSQSPSAAVGGDIGWVQPGQLDPQEEKVINQLQPGQVAGPVRLNGGYYLLLLVERRAPQNQQADITYNLAQVNFPAIGIAPEAAMAKAQKMTADARSCGEMNKIGRTVSTNPPAPLNNVHLADLPANARSIVSVAKVAMPTPPVQTKDGATVYMVCSRQGGASDIDRDQITDNLLRDRVENLGNGYLHELRRLAYIDLRV